VLPPLLAPQGTDSDWREERMDEKTDGQIKERKEDEQRITTTFIHQNQYTYRQTPCLLLYINND
jgi:hypothetical protein